jgi:hypothetical protein
MSLAEVLSAKGLGGRLLSHEDAAAIRGELGGAVPDWLLEAMQSHALVGVSLVLAEDEDASGLGAEMRWFDAAGMISEARDAQPGRAALPLGYVPIAECLIGSGDPYFIKTAADPEQSQVVRIPHDAVRPNGELEETAVEPLGMDLVQFMQAVATED